MWHDPVVLESRTYNEFLFKGRVDGFHIYYVLHSVSLI